MACATWVVRQTGRLLEAMPGIDRGQKAQSTDFFRLVPGMGRQFRCQLILGDHANRIHFVRQFMRATRCFSTALSFINFQMPASSPQAVFVSRLGLLVLHCTGASCPTAYR